MGRHRLTLQREDIRSAAAVTAALPRRVEAAGISYSGDTDTLYVLADRRRLVALSLMRPYEMKVPSLGLCQFTRIVLSLDEPERFCAALSSKLEAEITRDDSTAGAAAASARANTTGSTAFAFPIGALDSAITASISAVSVNPVPTAAAPLAAESPQSHCAGAVSHDAYGLRALQDAETHETDDEEALRLIELVKRYGGFTAVAGIDLAVRRGEVLAFLGTNGAGKSSTIRMAAGLLRPTAGRVLVEGRDLWAEGAPVRRLLGYVPDVPLLHESLTAREFLWMMAGLYGLPEAEGRQRAAELLAQMGLERWRDTRSAPSRWA